MRPTTLMPASLSIEYAARPWALHVSLTASLTASSLWACSCCVAPHQALAATCRQKYIEEQLAARLGKSAAQIEAEENDPEVKRRKVRVATRISLASASACRAQPCLLSAQARLKSKRDTL